jgi:CRP-like cAMP-binding protein
MWFELGTQIRSVDIRQGAFRPQLRITSQPIEPDRFAEAYIGFVMRYTMETGRPHSRLLARFERFNALLPLKLINFPANSDIVSQVQISSRCSLLLDGFLYSHKIVASRRQITSFYVPGDMADLTTLHLPRLDHTITTLGPAVLAFVPHAALREVLDQSPRLAQAFWRETLVQACIFQEWVVNLGRRDASARLAHIVCELITRLQAVGLARDLSFSMPWTQTDVADACGISSVHANRVIQEFRHLGLVEWESRRLKIRDWNRLVRLADFSEDYLQCHATKAEEPRLSAFREAFSNDAGFVYGERSS